MQSLEVEWHYTLSN